MIRNLPLPSLTAVLRTIRQSKKTQTSQHNEGVSAQRRFGTEAFRLAAIPYDCLYQSVGPHALTSLACLCAETPRCRNGIVPKRLEVVK